MKRFPYLILLPLLVIMLLPGCVPKDKLVYLQAEEATSDQVFKYDRQQYRLQVNDILDVQVRSMNEEANQLFNGGGSNNNQTAQASVRGGGDLYYVTGYSVNDSGFVELPIMGTVKVQGLTIPEAKQAIEAKVKSYFSKYFLKVQLGGIRFSALGEFNRPGKYVILQNQLTIFEALSTAGDLNTVADRETITLIRQYPDGTRMHKLNLLDQSIIGSPFYFVQPNDVLYAEPLPQKTYGLGVNGAQTITTVVSIVSTSLALILAIEGLNN